MSENIFDRLDRKIRISKERAERERQEQVKSTGFSVNASGQMSYNPGTPPAPPAAAPTIAPQNSGKMAVSSTVPGFPVAPGRAGLCDPVLQYQGGASFNTYTHRWQDAAGMEWWDSKTHIPDKDGCYITTHLQPQYRNFPAGNNKSSVFFREWHNGQWMNSMNGHPLASQELFWR